MHGPLALPSGRRNLSDTWVRRMLWRRAQDSTERERERFRTDCLTLSAETPISKCWSLFEPLVFKRRFEQQCPSGDRRDIVDIDGNAKLNRRSCGEFAAGLPPTA